MTHLLTRHLVLVLCIVPFGHAGLAQFYPDSNTSWCGRTIGPENWHYVLYYMGPAPDTSIAGETYKVTNEYTGETGEWVYVRSYYVRSSADGKGYAFLLDSMAEYMTGDTAALAGDTLHNILGWYDYYDGPCGSHGQEYALFDVIVDSTVTYTNNGVTVHRQFVHLPCAFDMNMPQPYFVFWQAGMGTSFGPLLRVGSPLGQNEQLESSTSAGVCQFNNADGLPGGTPYCWPVYLAGVPEEEQANKIIARPNPSNGVFEFKGTERTPIEVLDALGRLLYWANGPLIDLSSFAPGCYHARLHARTGVQQVPLLLVK